MTEIKYAGQVALVTGATRGIGAAIAHELVAAYEEDIDHELQCLHEAIGRCDAARLRHHAHRLQGALQMLGAAVCALVFRVNLPLALLTTLKIYITDCT